MQELNLKTAPAAALVNVDGLYKTSRRFKNFSDCSFRNDQDLLALNFFDEVSKFSKNELRNSCFNSFAEKWINTFGIHECSTFVWLHFMFYRSEYWLGKVISDKAIDLSTYSFKRHINIAQFLRWKEGIFYRRNELLYLAALDYLKDIGLSKITVLQSKQIGALFFPDFDYMPDLFRAVDSIVLNSEV